MDKNCDLMQNEKKEEGPGSSIYPVIVGAPETTIDVGSVDSEEEDWMDDALESASDANNVSTINVEKSSDVVIGPMTQFHGPVTIYQNILPDHLKINDNLSVKYKNEVISAQAKQSPDTPSEKISPTVKLLSRSHKRLAIYAALSFTMLVSIVVGIAVSLNVTSHNGDEGDKITKPPDFTEDTNKENSSIGDFKIFTRENWGGRKPLNFTRPLQHPTKYVIISHTAGSFCDNFLRCSEIMRSIQALHVAEQKSPDIGYNFLIGGDGNVYVGRGWDIRNFHQDNNVGISFIGNFVFDEMTPKMISTLQGLLDHGVNKEKISPEYKLLCHNQTYATLSPGVNVYKEVSKFPHFIAGYVDID